MKGIWICFYLIAVLVGEALSLIGFEDASARDLALRLIGPLAVFVGGYGVGWHMKGE